MAEPHLKPEVDPRRGLEEAHRLSVEALDGVMAVVDMRHLLGRGLDIEGLFRSAFSRLRRLLPIRDGAFLVLDEDTMTFRIACADPDDAVSRLDDEVEAQIESGTFAWAIEQHRCVIVAGAGHSPVLLGVLETAAAVRGMFIATLGEDALRINRLSLDVCSMLLGSVSCILEMMELGHRLADHNRELERMVEQRTADLQAARNQALRASESKGRYLAMVSHELRNPMHALVGIVHGLRRAVPDGHRQELQLLDTCSHHMLSIVNDVLDLGKIEAGHLELANEPFSPLEVVEQAVLIFRPLVAERGLRLEWHVDPDLPPLVSGDPVRFRQIAVNYLSNAVKHTRAGSVRLTLNGQCLGHDECEVLLAVTDTGPGIPPERQVKLFEDYTTWEDGIRSTYGSTGLGLGINRHLAEAMNGTVGVDSAVGSGSRFWARLVFRVGGGVPVPPRLARPPASAWVVASSRLEREFLGDLFASWGCRATVVADALELPVDDGMAEVVVTEHAQLAALPSGVDRGAVIVIVDADEAPPPAGVQRPLIRAELADRIAEHLTADPTTGASCLVPDHPRAELRLLVVEDDPINRKILDFSLRRYGIEVEAFESAEEGLARYHDGGIDVVISDCRLPGMSGGELAQALRRAGCRIPLIALTGDLTVTSELKDAGFDDVLVKPVRPDHLAQVVVRARDRRRGE